MHILGRHVVVLNLGYYKSLVISKVDCGIAVASCICPWFQDWSASILCASNVSKQAYRCTLFVWLQVVAGFAQNALPWWKCKVVVGQERVGIVHAYKR